MLTSQSSKVFFNYTKTYIENRELKKEGDKEGKKEGSLKAYFQLFIDHKNNIYDIKNQKITKPLHTYIK